LILASGIAGRESWLISLSKHRYCFDGISLAIAVVGPLIAFARQVFNDLHSVGQTFTPAFVVRINIRQMPSGERCHVLGLIKPLADAFTAAMNAEVFLPIAITVAWLIRIARLNEKAKVMMI
jgi:hypothetical protein